MAPTRAAIVTGGSRGIGLAIAEALAENGFGLTITARRPDALQQSAERLRERGHEVEHMTSNVADEGSIREVVARHRERFGRLDVLVNNAGVGVGASAQEHRTKLVDLQIDVNLRATVLFYRECLELLLAAGAEHGGALVVNLASIAGKVAPPWLSVYGATKAAVISYTRSMNRELAERGVRSTAFCPGFVDTDMTDHVKESIPPEEMIRVSDLAEAVRFLLRLSPSCVVPEIVFERPGEAI